MKKILIAAAVILGLILTAGGIFFWNMYREMMVMETIKYDPQLTIITGGGSNSIVLTSEDGSKTLLVDTKMFKGSEKIRELIKTKDLTIVITHNHPDHIYGLSLFPEAKTIAGNVNISKEKFPDIPLKHGEEKIFKIGNETVHVKNMGHAHSTNDVIVYLENRKLLVTGDLVFLNMHPVLAEAKISSWIDVLDKMNTYDIKTVVPGHGRVMDKSAIIIMKDYFTSIIDALGDKKKLQTLKIKFRDYSSLPANLSFYLNVNAIEKQRNLIK